MKVLVCGGRDYSDRKFIYDTLDALHLQTPITQIINGGATGADSIAHQWALDRDIPTSSYPADWASYGRSAGPIRNAQMLALNPQLVVAFEGGRGTQNMITQTKKTHIPIMDMRTKLPQVHRTSS